MQFQNIIVILTILKEYFLEQLVHQHLQETFEGAEISPWRYGSRGYYIRRIGQNYLVQVRWQPLNTSPKSSPNKKLYNTRIMTHARLIYIFHPGWSRVDNQNSTNYFFFCICFWFSFFESEVARPEAMLRHTNVSSFSSFQDVRSPSGGTTAMPRKCCFRRTRKNYEGRETRFMVERPCGADGQPAIDQRLRKNLSPSIRMSLS